MKKAFTVLLLVVVCAFMVINSFSESSFEELDREYDDLLAEWKRLNDIRLVYENGLTIFPAGSYEDEHIVDAYTDIPKIDDHEAAIEYIGTPYVLTGTVIDKDQTGIHLQLDDGRRAYISFWEYDFAEDKSISFGPRPQKGTKCNVICTFKDFGVTDGQYRYLFIASATDEARELCMKGKE